MGRNARALLSQVGKREGEKTADGIDVGKKNEGENDFIAEKRKGGVAKFTAKGFRGGYLV